MSLRLARTCGSLAILVLLSGCFDPFREPGTWHATGVNQANLDAEATDRRDTVAGHQDPGSDAILDTAAIVRLHAGAPRPLKVETTNGGS